MCRCSVHDVHAQVLIVSAINSVDGVSDYSKADAIVEAQQAPSSMYIYIYTEASAGPLTLLTHVLPYSRTHQTTPLLT